MFKRMIVLGLFLAGSVYAEDIPPPPPPTSPLVAMLPLPYFHKPDNGVYMTKQEYQAMLNNDYFEKQIYNMEKSDKQIKQALSRKLPNYSVDLGKDKKEKILQAIKDVIDKKENFYQAFKIHYTLKYTHQCPIYFHNNGTLDEDICHETYDEYLHKKIWSETVHFSKNYPTFWHDTEYSVPDKKYISNKVKDIFIENDDYLNLLIINTKNICILNSDIISFFNIDKKQLLGEDINFETYFYYHNTKILLFKHKNLCTDFIRTGD